LSFSDLQTGTNNAENEDSRVNYNSHRNTLFSISNKCTGTTLEKKQVFELMNFNLQCGEKSYSENIIISRDGATIEIPLKHISIMRSLQHKNGFFIQTEDGKN
jgi:hypothetical protein